MERPLFRTLYGKRSAEKTARLSTLNSLGQLMPIGVGRNTPLKTDLALLKWGVGLVIAGVAAQIMKAFFG